MIEFLGKLAGALMGPEHDSDSRALLYVKGKKESRLQSKCLQILKHDYASDRSRTEYPLGTEQVKHWNALLDERGYFDDKSGLKKSKKKGRIDVVGIGQDNSLSHLLEIKLWSAGDAVDNSRYLLGREGREVKHSISKSFEVDALKIFSIEGEMNLHRCIVTAMFTLHCDGMPKSDLKARKMPYLDLLTKQNKDKAGFGTSDDYRRVGLDTMLTQLGEQFGPGTSTNAKFSHVAAFGRSSASWNGVDISLDLILAELGMPTGG